MTLKEQLIIDEGMRLFPYKCSQGYWTIGVGRNLETNTLSSAEKTKLAIDKNGVFEVIEYLKKRGITIDEAMYLLDNDIASVTRELTKAISWIISHPKPVQEVFLNMVFNLGISRFLKFKKTIEFVKNADYKSASVEMLDSDWSKQVGERAKRLSFILSQI